MGIPPHPPPPLIFVNLDPSSLNTKWKLEGRNWKAETENGACRCRWIGRDPGVASDLSSSRLKLPHPTNHKFSDSLVLVVEPPVFAVCIAGSTDSLSTQLSFDSTWPDSLGPGDRLRPTQTQRSTVRFSVLFSRNHARISRENTRPDGNSREIRRYSLPAAALCSGDIISHRDGPPLTKGDSILHSSTNGRGVLRLLYGSPPLPLASSFSNKTPARFKRRGENRTPSSPVINPARPSSTSHPSPRRARCRKQVIPGDVIYHPVLCLLFPGTRSSCYAPYIIGTLGSSTYTPTTSLSWAYKQSNTLPRGALAKAKRALLAVFLATRRPLFARFFHAALPNGAPMLGEAARDVACVWMSTLSSFCVRQGRLPVPWFPMS